MISEHRSARSPRSWSRSRRRRATASSQRSPVSAEDPAAASIASPIEHPSTPPIAPSIAAIAPFGGLAGLAFSGTSGSLPPARW